MVVVAINCMTMVWPLVRMVLVGKHAEYYEKVLWLAGCPHRCYMSYCGGEARAAAERDKAKQAREAKRRAAGVHQKESVARMDTTNSDGSSKLMDAIRRAQVTATEERVHPATASGQGAGFAGDQDLGMHSYESQQRHIETGNSAQQVFIGPSVAVLGFAPLFPPAHRHNGGSQDMSDSDQVLHEVLERCQDYSRNEFIRKLKQLGYTEHVEPSIGLESSETQFKSLEDPSMQWAMMPMPVAALPGLDTHASCELRVQAQQEQPGPPTPKANGSH